MELACTEESLGEPTTPAMSTAPTWEVNFDDVQFTAKNPIGEGSYGRVVCAMSICNLHIS